MNIGDAGVLQSRQQNNKAMMVPTVIYVKRDTHTFPLSVVTKISLEIITSNKIDI